MSILEGALAFSMATLISRILGLLRDALLAYKFGASKELDAYMVAILFPFFLRKVFAEGAMVSAFLPVYGSKADKDSFVSGILNSLGVITLSIAILVNIEPEYAVKILALGYSSDAVEISAELLRITIFFVPSIFVWAVFYSVLNYRGKFFLPALTPAFVNVGVILGAVLDGVKGCAIGFLSGSIVGTVVLAVSSKLRYRFVFTWDGEFYSLFFKSILAMAVSQLNILVDTNVASFTGEGSVSVIQLSSRLYNLPLGLFGVAISTVALSHLISSSEKMSKLKEALERSLFLSIPSSLGLIVLSRGIVELIYGRGNFTAEDVVKTSTVLTLYSIGIPAYSVLQTLMRYHHSIKDMETPLRAMWIVSGLNAILDVILSRFVGLYGIPLATTISGYVGTIYMTRGKDIFSREMIKIMVSSIGMVFALVFLPKSSIWVLISVAIGGAIYGSLCWILRCESFEDFLRIIRRSR